MLKYLTVAALLVTAGPALSDDLTDGLHAFNDQFNSYVVGRDIEGMMSLYDEDVLWIEPGKRPSQGRDGVPRETFTFLTQMQGSLTHTVDHLYISADGTQAVMIGEADVLVEQADLDITGSYLFVLERQDDRWEIVTDMFNYYDD